MTLKKSILTIALIATSVSIFATTTQPTPDQVATAMDQAITTGLKSASLPYTCSNPDYCYGVDHAFNNQYYVHVSEATKIDGVTIPVTKLQTLHWLRQYTKLPDGAKANINCPDNGSNGTWVCAVTVE